MVGQTKAALPGEGTGGMIRRIAPRDGRILALTTLGVLALLAAAELAVMLRNPTIVPGMVGDDYRLYMDATRRWLAGGEFYSAWQLAGPYTSADWPILYPPQVLALFVPFTFLPAALWFALPPILTAWVVISHRPRLWTWPVMLGLFAFFPMLWLPYVSGTPTIWIAAAVAAGTRWGWPAALVLVKPTLAPFALLGCRNRSWWVTALAVAALGLLALPLTFDWLTAVLHFRGGSLFYSVGDVPMMLVPLVARLGRTQRSRPPR